MPAQPQPVNPSGNLYQHLDIRLVLRASKLGVWELDGPTGLVNWDNQCRNLFGYDNDEQVSYETAARCIHPDDVPWVNKAIEATLTWQSDAPYDVTYRISRADNQELRWIHSVGQAYFTPTGELIRFIGVNQDVTEHRLLARSEAHLRAIIDASPVAITSFVGRSKVISTINQPFIDVMGKGTDIIGEPLADIMPELEDQPFLNLIDNVYASQQPFHGFAMPVRVVRQGVAYDEFYNVSYSPLLDEQAQAYAVLGIAVDVTPLQRQQQQLEQLVEQRTQELASSNEELAAGNEELIAINGELEETNSLLMRSNENLQTFAYIASHDLQEPLRKIQQFGDLLQARLTGSAGDEERAYLDRMQLAAGRMSALIKDLLSFSRIATQRSLNGTVSLQAVVGQVIETLDLLVTEKQAQLQIGPLPAVPGDAAQLGQLFQNLLTNALKFQCTDPSTNTPIPPRIQISAQLLTFGELPIVIKPTRRVSTYYRIDVSDNGIGFDEKYLDRIFQVFQRLHGRTKFDGTGVGLAICEKVVANHGGVITARSQPGQGATFLIYLPAD